ncbi:Crp/Fnr family transcriptional regulator [Paraburkholderia sp. DGU8]|jgi:CRP-like cAMP-binding protein|uniref:Crp/Fnr family transcriptional regulator n=1 Tax=Paraburkholderia sp. DGU8 TaxID=3161997 RepID=UPI0034664C9A
MEALLRKQTLFSMASDDIVKRAGAMVRMAEFAPGDHVCFQGDPRSPLMLVISGQLRTSTLSEDGREIPVRTVNVGQSVGEEPILLNSSIHGNIVAVRKSTVALFSRAHARQLFDEPNVARALNSSMAGRVMHLVERHALQGLSRADARISAVIESTIGNSEKDESPLIELPNQATIAAMAKVSRETVSRVLKSLTARGVIVKEGRRIRVRDRDTLHRLAAG